MKNPLFLASVLEQSANQIFNEKTRFSGMLYRIVLFSLAGVLVAINLIHIDVNVRASGVIKPREDHVVVLTTANGFLEHRNLVLNAHINEGDTLAIIRSEIITAKLPALQRRQEELRILISDLMQLTTRDLSKVSLSSSIYKQDILYFLSQWTDADSKRKKALSAYERAKKTI